MKVVSLNCWAGKLYPLPIKSILQWAPETDIFCFQEMIFGGPDDFFSHYKIRGRLFEKIKEALKEYNAFWSPTPRKSVFGLDGYHLEYGAKLGQAIFIKKSIEVSEADFFLTYQLENDPFKNMITGEITGICQYIDFKIKDKTAVMINIHGLWQMTKRDTPERLEQSRKILDFIKNRRVPAVLIGDFNLNPDTKSIAMLGKNLTNFIS